MKHKIRTIYIMSNSVVYKWRLKCAVHSNVFVWNDIKPTMCPVNTADSIDTTKTVIVDKIEQNTVTIKEENGVTGGNFRTESHVLTVLANSVISKDVIWQYPVSVLEAYFMPTAINTGDMFNLTIAPQTTIGIVVVPVNIGATSITVNSTVIDNISVGFKLYITNGVNTNCLGQCLTINKITRVLTFQTPPTQDFSPASYVQMSICIIENYEIGPPGRYLIGEGKIGGSFIPAGITARLTYTNTTNIDKKFYAYIEYLY